MSASEGDGGGSGGEPETTGPGSLPSGWYPDRLGNVRDQTGKIVEPRTRSRAAKFVEAITFGRYTLVD